MLVRVFLTANAFFLAMVLSSCASTWVIQTEGDLGVIGYQNYATQAEADQAIEKLIPCATFTYISDQPVNRTLNYPRLVPLAVFSNPTAGLEEISSASAWREVTYQCAP
jgi:hypothetical protein